MARPHSGLGRETSSLASMMRFVLVALLSCAPAAALGVWYAQTSGSLLAAQRTQALDRLSALTADGVERFVHERRNDVAITAAMPLLWALNPVTLASTLDRFVTTGAPAYVLAAVTDGAGQIVAVNRVTGTGQPLAAGALVGQSVAQEPWFTQTLQAGSSILVEDFHVDPLAQAATHSTEPVMSLSAPIANAEGAVVGVLSVRLSSEPLRSLLQRTASGDAPTVALLNHHDQLIAGAVPPDSRPLAAVDLPGILSTTGLRWKLGVYEPAGPTPLPDTKQVAAGLALCLLAAAAGIGWAVKREWGRFLPPTPSKHVPPAIRPLSPPPAAPPQPVAQPSPPPLPPLEANRTISLGSLIGQPKLEEPPERAVPAAVPTAAKPAGQPGSALAEERWAKLSRCFQSLTGDPDQNIARLTALCGELLGATYAVYDRLRDGSLYALGQWQTPPGFNPVEKPDGRMAHDVIVNAAKESQVLRNLPQTSYAQTDPSVSRDDLRTYVGRAVFSNGTAVGALGAAFGRDVEPTALDHELMGVLAATIGLEEDRKQADTSVGLSEDHMRQLQRLDAGAQLAAAVAHQFNNCLTAILGKTNLLQNTLEPDSRAAGELHEIVTAADRASTLIQHLQTFSRRQLRQPQLLDLNALISDMLPLVRQIVGERIRVETDLASALSPVFADRSQFEQVVFSLCLNARDAMPKGGTLTLSTAEIQVDSPVVEKQLRKKAGTYVTLTIRDTGAGMDEFVKAHCFEPFFTTKPKGEGAGLGLSIVYGIVQQSSGAIAVESRPEEGTTVTIYLPPTQAAPTLKGKPSTARPVIQGTETLLLVEDENQVRQVMRRALQDQGYHVLEAAKGSTALGLSTNHHGRIDLLITDVVMPEMSGKELARILCVTRPELHVLFISGYPPDPSLLENGSGGMKSFLSKPFSPAVLVQKVREMLGKAPGDAAGSSPAPS